ncbi:MAG: OsmC family protein [Sphingobacteriia bacterium]|nr:OsmC family protein [Sphingobacteriia bacterium]
MNIDVKTTWSGKMAFESNVDGHQIKMDADASVGGDDSGARPKKLLLAGLAGCTGMDVVSILDKMKVSFDSFEIITDAVQTEDHPKVYEKITITYVFSGKDLPEDKLRRAIELSQDKYCGVSAMLRKSSELDWKLVIK